MDRLISLYRKLERNGVYLFTWELGKEKGITMEMNGEYAIFMDFENIDSEAEEVVVVLHEGGHASTGATHKVYSQFDLVAKHENKAWKWAVVNYISKSELDKAVAEGYDSIWSLSKHFNVTEEFMRKIVCWYKHGNLDVEHYMCS